MPEKKKNFLLPFAIFLSAVDLLLLLLVFLFGSIFMTSAVSSPLIYMYIC